MMAGAIHDNRPQLGSFLIELPLVTLNLANICMHGQKTQQFDFFPKLDCWCRITSFRASVLRFIGIGVQSQKSTLLIEIVKLCRMHTHWSKQCKSNLATRCSLNQKEIGFKQSPCPTKEK